MSKSRDLSLNSSASRDLARKPFMFKAPASLEKVHCLYHLSNSGFDASKKAILHAKRLGDLADQ
jgi:hypothetical protein